ncbi:hypothetical protein SVAN01_11835, partial [Stagonosporopsis vannaccii]
GRGGGTRPGPLSKARPASGAAALPREHRRPPAACPPARCQARRAGPQNHDIIAGLLHGTSPPRPPRQPPMRRRVVEPPPTRCPRLAIGAAANTVPGECSAGREARHDVDVVAPS